MEHLKEGLIKQRGTIKYTGEIPILKFEDIWVNGNVVILNEGGILNLYMVLSELEISDHYYIYSGDQYPMLVNSHGSYYCVSSFKISFPKHEYYYNNPIEITKVFRTGINSRSIKTVEDVKKALKPFEIYYEQ